jgi:hypothetical protein
LLIDEISQVMRSTTATRGSPITHHTHEIEKYLRKLHLVRRSSRAHSQRGTAAQAMSTYLQGICVFLRSLTIVSGFCCCRILPRLHPAPVDSINLVDDSEVHGSFWLSGLAVQTILFFEYSSSAKVYRGSGPRHP